MECANTQFCVILAHNTHLPDKDVTAPCPNELM